MKKALLFMSGCVLLASGANAQYLKQGYITLPSSSSLHTYVNGWSKENPNSFTMTNSSGESVAWEDQNFFISRVKIKPYITNLKTQVNPNIKPEEDKKLLFWVPVGNTNVRGCFTGALPNGVFDSEVFSLWPYVTYYGDWISPYGWIGGAFADAAHKHGTAVAGQASIPNAALSGDWLTCITAMGSMSSDTQVQKLGDFLNYHGVDGLGYNSEFSSSASVVQNLSTMHGKLMKYMHKTLGNTKFENPWYTGTNYNGGIDFTSALTSSNKDIFGDSVTPKTSLFVNYEWVSYLSTTEAQLPITKRDGRDLYMGMNMQASCKRDNEWTTHQTTNYSIGLWGAHDFNYLWSGRSGKGGRDIQKQTYYQQRLEQWFTNGNQNPANRIDVFATKSLQPAPDWFGMSSFMTARSTLGWDLSTEPFYSFFNLGNGTFFNWKGQRMNDNEWYNIGVQDYMPTWRFWWATELLGGTKDKVNANGLKAEFTWEDAYVGGSCLRIHGTSTNEYLHLFKTQFALKRNDVITVRYKLLGGKTKANLALTLKDGESAAIKESSFKIIELTTTPDDGEWSTATFKLTGSIASSFNDKTLALVALHFENAENLDMYLGEFSIKRGTAATPAAPSVSKSKVLSYNKSGIDGKIIFNMASSKASGEPVYNLDVNASMFKLYAQYEGGEEQFMGVTSSWAGMYYGVSPDVDSPAKIRFGVRAVSTDTDSESAITWGDYITIPAYETSDAVEIDKQVIKPGESFTVKYSDPAHSEATKWSILNSGGTEVRSQNGGTEFICGGLDDIGGYDVVVTDASGSEVRYPYMIQVSAKEKGALPEIQTLTVNGSDAVSQESGVTFGLGEKITLGYTGREANGAASRGIRIDNKMVGGKMSDIGKSGGSQTSFTIAAWVKFEYPAGESCCFGIENRAGTWPQNNWGFFWFDIFGTNGGTTYGTDVSVGTVASYTFRTTVGTELKYKFSNTVIPNGAWTHIAITFDWSGSDFKSELYVNGTKQVPVAVESTTGTPTATDDKYFSISNKSVLADNMWFYIGGGRGSEPNYNDGDVDNVVVWDGAMTAENVKTVMAGLDKNNLPSEVIALWDFESDCDSNGEFAAAAGTKSTAKISCFSLLADGNEGAGAQTPGTPTYTAGSPFIPGSGFKVETVPTWTTRKVASITDATGTDQSGSANISYPLAGDYNVKLSLDNAYGSHSLNYPVFTVAETAAIGDIAGDAGEMNAYTVHGTLFVEFAADGDYTVSVFNTSGQLVGKNTQSIVAGQNMSITLANPGVYVVNVVKDGRTLRAIKVLNK